MTKEEKVLTLLQDEETLKEIFVEDEEQTLANFAAHGVEMNSEELNELCSGVLAGMRAEEKEDELSEDSLENVAGGSFVIGWVLKDVYTAIKGGVSKGRKDKKNKSTKGMSYIEEANTFVGKGFRAIGYTIGWYLS